MCVCMCVCIQYHVPKMNAHHLKNSYGAASQSRLQRRALNPLDSDTLTTQT